MPKLNMKKHTVKIIINDYVLRQQITQALAMSGYPCWTEVHKVEADSFEKNNWVCFETIIKDSHDEKKT